MELLISVSGRKFPSIELSPERKGLPPLKNCVEGPIEREKICYLYLHLLILKYFWFDQQYFIYK